MSLGLVVAAIGGMASASQAGGGPQNVFLVVNAGSEASRTVANHYIDLRKIPSNNVFYLKYRGNKVAVRGSQFRERILSPILGEILKRGLGNQIDYIVYSCDFPWRVDFRKDYSEEKFPRHLTPVASLTSATYLYVFVEQKRKELFGLANNLYSSPPNDLVVVSRAFRSSYRWTVGGRRAGQDGLPYMLSAMLGVNSIPGNTVDEIAWYLERSAQADGTAPKGNIYFAVNNDVRSKTRDATFQSAVRAIQLAGVEAEIIQDTFPQYKQNVAGVTSGYANVDPAGSHSRILPGAFCDNLTSSGGQFLPEKKQTLITEFLKMGAGGACGTVVEPLALPQKFPNSTLHVHYVHGCSMAESFYQSVAGPFQQILLGDPLCQPWAKRPKITVIGAKANSFVKDTIELIPSAELAQGSISSFQLFVDGTLVTSCAPGERFRLDTTQLADGYHELRVIGTENSPIEVQGQWIADVIVKNGMDALQLRVDEKSAETSGPLNVQVTSTKEANITVYAGGVELGQVKGNTGSLAVDKTLTGAGPVTLYAIVDGDVRLRSQRVRVVVKGN